MALNLIDQIKGYVTPDLVQRAAAYAGESESATHQAVGAIVPSLVGALANQASTPAGAQQLAKMLDAGKYDGSALTSLGSLFSGGTATQNAIGDGKSILDSLFGAKLSGVINLIARSTGVRSGSASSLLALITPVIMHVIGKQRASVGQSPSALTTLLGEQKGFLGSLLPSGLASLLGWSGFTADAPEVVAGRPAGERYREAKWEPTPVVPKRAGYWNWLLPLLILGGLALAGLLWLTNWQDAPRTAVTTPAAPVRSAVRMTDLQLPGGVRVSVPEGSFNFSIYQWLASSDTTVPKRFVFDNLNFETGTTQLTPESVPTVDALVAIIKAYPSAAFGLEGHTDSTGDAAANKKLSLDRANAVKARMVSAGVADSRISTAGYGSEKPLASNDTEDGRSKNRRTELVVEKK